MILLAIGVIYHPVDVNAITGIHGQNEGKPTRAEIRARLDSVGGTKTNNDKQNKTTQKTYTEQQQSVMRNGQHFIKNIAFVIRKKQKET